MRLLLRAPRRRRRRGVLGSVLFGLAFVAMGIGVFAALVALPVLRAFAARDWTETTCVVERSDVATRTDSDGDTVYRVDVAYRYVVDGRTYRGSRFDFVSHVSTGSQRTAADKAARAPVGAAVPCWYDPDAPSSAVLDRNGWIGIVGLVPLAFGVVGVGIIIDALRGRRGPRRIAHPDGRVTILRRGAQGLEVLFIGGFALAFGPAGLAVAFAGAGWIAIPFVLVGGGLTAFFLYKLAALGTRVAVTLDRAEVRAGESVEVTWTVRGPLLAPRRIAARLVGRERTEYSSGDDTEVKTHTLHERDLVPAQRVQIPRKAVPTVDVGPNTIDWVVQVRGELPLWPDVDVEVPIVVRAADEDEPAPDDAPAAPAPARLALALDGDRRAFAPGDRIAGVVAWRRDAAPRKAVLRLAWASKGIHASHREVVGEIDVAELTREIAPRGGDPYRSAAIEDTGAPLGATEQRRFRLDPPDHPSSYRGELFAVTWQLEVEVDGDTETVDLAIGPRRAPTVSGA